VDLLAEGREAELRGRPPVGNVAPFLASPPLLTCPVRGERRGEERSRERPVRRQVREEE
jgi:hypothetical protein